MDFYGNKDDVVEAEKELFGEYVRGLHPEDEAQAYHEMSEWAGGMAKECEERNERIGVPDRSVPHKSFADLLFPPVKGDDVILPKDEPR